MELGAEPRTGRAQTLPALNPGSLRCSHTLLASPSCPLPFLGLWEPYHENRLRSRQAMHSPSFLPHPCLPKYYPRILLLGGGEYKDLCANNWLLRKRGTWDCLGGRLGSSLLASGLRVRPALLPVTRHLRPSPHSLPVQCRSLE